MIKKYNDFLNENITETGAFKYWFGDSKVVDDNGNPLVVYHGTSDEITSFASSFGSSHTSNNEVGAFYFTSDFDVAEDYSRQAYVKKKQQGGENDDRDEEEIANEADEDGHIKVVEAYLSMENPLIMTSDDSIDGMVDTQLTDKLIDYIKGINNQMHIINPDNDMWEFFDERAWYDEDDLEGYRDEIEEYARENLGLDEDAELEGDDFKEAAEQYANDTGAIEKQYPEYDGIIWYNVYDGISDASTMVQNVYIVIEPTQIKSVNNRGTFGLGTDNIFEYAEYHNLHGDDEYNITNVKRDDNHDYEYCDGVLYELSNSGEDIMVNIDSVEHTDENMFYQDQIERYIEYIEDGGILETLPVTEMPIGYARNLQEMCDYLGERENFDTMYDIIKGYKELYDDLGDVAWDSEEKGIKEGLLSLIKNKNDLDEHYGKSYKEEYEDEEYIYEDGTLYWKEDYYNGFIAILEYWDDNKEYSLTDMNHRFAALKELGKSMVYVDPS